MPTYNHVGGPGVINGEDSMNGLANADTSALEAISDFWVAMDKSISELKALLTKISADQGLLKAAVTRIRAEQANQMQALFVIEQSVSPSLRRLVKSHSATPVLRS